MSLYFRRSRFCMTAFLLLSLGSSWTWAQGGPALVKLAPVVQREIGEGQTFVGTVMPSRRAVIGSAVDGRVVEYPINEGDRVEAKQPLAQLLTETISHEITAAEEEMNLRIAELQELENGSRREEIEQARARMQAAQATAAYRQAQKKRILALREQRGAATDQQVDEAISQEQEADELEKEASFAFDLIVKGPRQERIDQARARKAIQQAVVERLRDQRTKHTIISRFDGYIAAEYAEVGQWVSRGDPVAEVVALDEVDIEAKVVEGQVPHIRIGDSARVTIPALPEHSFTGRVVSIVPQADIRSRTFPVKVRVENIIGEDGQPLIRSGMLAQVVLPTGPTREATLVPKDALVLGGPKPLIWVVDPNQAASDGGSGMLTSTATATPIELGVADGDLIQVIEGVPEAFSVVVLGNERIVPAIPGAEAPVQWVPTEK